MKPMISDEKWLSILKDALDNNAKIAMNHKYLYKGYKLGSMLINAKYRKNKELFNKIEALGYNYTHHSKKPNDTIKTFIHDLWNDPNPFKGRYITRFNHYILPKKKVLDPELKEELVVVWKMKFGDRRKWSKRPGLKKRVKIWKKIRYDQELNPEGKWFAGTSRLKPIYYWVFHRKRSKDKMNEIAKYFNENEILELIKEGFPIDNPYAKKPGYKRITKKEKLLKQKKS